MIVVIWGVSGAGKTTVGELLAKELRWKFYDADDFHPQNNIEKMHAGVPLDDHDREPWLARLRERIQKSLNAGENAVLACSAIKRKYRDELRVSGQVKFVFLQGDQAQIAEQLHQRRGHFFNPELLRSQFEDLEEPQPDEDTITIQIGRGADNEVAEIRQRVAQ